MQHRILLAGAGGAIIDCGNGVTNSGQGASKEAFMNLRMRLNVLAAVVSLGFVAAIAFGMV